MERTDVTVTMLCDASGFDGDAKPKAKRTRKPRAKKAEASAAASAATSASAISASEPTETPAADSVTVEAAAVDATATTANVVEDDGRLPGDEIYQRIGHLTRTLHNALRELGYDKELMDARENLPDARDRLAYIARVTGEAAEKVLNAVDRARTVQETLAHKASDLSTRWQAVAAYTANNAARATPAGKQLVDETVQFFSSVGGQADATQAILTDIMMAQDFHDLTGQVIRKVVTLATTLEEQLLKLLLETTPPEQRKKVESHQLEGPVVVAEGRDDVVTDQAGVDDLLASLGF